MKKHYDEVDILKGIAIALVILGHSIIVYPINLNTEYRWCGLLHNAVSTVHLPLFFVVSGFCYRFADLKSYVVKKVKRILIPLLVFSIIGIVPGLIFPELVNGTAEFLPMIKSILLGKSDRFLNSILGIFIIFPLIDKLVAGRRTCQIITGIVLLGLRYFTFWPEVYCIDRIITYLIFFYGGYLFRQYFERLSSVFPHINNIAGFVISTCIWAGFFVLLEKNGEGVFLDTTIRLFAALAGIIALFFFARMINGRKLGYFLQPFGQVSLQLYLFNGYFLTLTRTLLVKLLHISSPFIIIPVNFIVMFFVSYLLIHFVVKRFKVTRFLTGIVEN